MIGYIGTEVSGMGKGPQLGINFSHITGNLTTYNPKQSESRAAKALGNKKFIVKIQVPIWGKQSSVRFAKLKTNCN